MFPYATLFALTLTLTASAFPSGLPSDFASSDNSIVSPINALVGEIQSAVVCNGPDQFGLANHGVVVFKPVAAGTICEDGQIKPIVSQLNTTSISATATLTQTPVSTSSVTVTSTQYVTILTSSSMTSSASASSTVTSSTTSPPTPISSPVTSASTPSPSGYKMYTGDGSTSAGWPAESDFATFDALWAANEPLLAMSCSQFKQADNSPQEIADLKNAIRSVAKSTGVDERFVLAIAMQESQGCVRVWSTSYSVVNPGLFQTHEGTGTCNTGTVTTNGTVSNPCPTNQITQMVHDGVAGTASGMGLQQCVSQTGATDASKFFRAARIYNSGSIVASGELEKGIATHCYSSDVANRMTGALSAGMTGCRLDHPAA